MAMKHLIDFVTGVWRLWDWNVDPEDPYSLNFRQAVGARWTMYQCRPKP